MSAPNSYIADHKREIENAANELDQMFRQRHSMKEVEYLLRRVVNRCQQLRDSSGGPSKPVAWLYEADGFADAFSKARIPLDRMFGNPKETPLYASPTATVEKE